MITVFLAKALICFSGMCYPALIGPNTYPGEYQLQHRYVLSDGYGGDVLQYSEDDKTIYAIHRVWTLKPEEQRLKKLASTSVEMRTNVTHGCINVSNQVYEKLVNCCSSSRLIIK